MQRSRTSSEKQSANELRYALDAVKAEKHRRNLTWQTVMAEYFRGENGDQLLSLSAFLRYKDNPDLLKNVHGSKKDALRKAKQKIDRQKLSTHPLHQLYAALVQLTTGGVDEDVFSKYTGTYRLWRKSAHEDKPVSSTLEFRPQSKTGLPAFIHSHHPVTLSDPDEKNALDHEGLVLIMPSRLFLLGLGKGHLSLKIVQRHDTPHRTVLSGRLLSEQKKTTVATAFVLYSDQHPKRDDPNHIKAKLNALSD